MATGSSEDITTVVDRDVFLLEVPTPKLLTEQEELKVFRAAYAQTPHSRQVRSTLGSLLFRLDRFEELCALLEEWKVDEFPFLLLQINALHALRMSNDLRFDGLCLRALEQAADGSERAETLILMAEASIRAEDIDKARKLLVQALAANPSHQLAYRRLFRLDLMQGHAERVAAYSAERIRTGDTRSDVIASLNLAQAQMGQVEAAHETQGLHYFLSQTTPDPPEGWTTLADFNHELAKELIEQASMRYGRKGYSSRLTWHVPQPDLQRARYFPAFQRMIEREVAAYCRRLPRVSHPFLRSRPEAGTLDNWCVITEGEGHETWHLHPGWLSGTYYVQVPEHISDGKGREGCIAFGLPEETANEDDVRRFGEVLVRPQNGLLVLFPSHVYHKTYPHHGPGRRICCAFDITLTQR